MKLFLKSLFILFIILSFPVFVSAADYYVSPTGSDTAAGSISAPWKTVQKAANTAVAGDTIYIRQGEYAEMVQFNNRNGTSTKPITFKSYSGERATIKSTNWTGILIYNNSSWITLENLGVYNASYHGISVSYASHITINNCESYNNGWAGVFIAGAIDQNAVGGDTQFNTVINSRIHNNTHEGIYMKSGWSTEIVSDMTVENNEIYGNGDEGVQNSYWEQSTNNPRKPFNAIIRNNNIHDNHGDWGIIDITGENILVEKNRIYNNTSTNSGSGDVGFTCQKADGVIIRNNILYNNTSPWASDSVLYASDGCNNVQFYNNTIYHSSNRGIYLYKGSTDPGPGAIIVKNNIFSNQPSSQITWYLPGSTPNLTVDHNLFGKSVSAELDKTNIIGDAGFVNAANNDFHLLANSLAVNSGVNLLTYVPDDFDGLSRPIGSGFDIGAYEYAGVSNPTPTPSPKSGDADGNGIINLADMVRWLNGYLKNLNGTANGDFDGNGKTDGKDYIIWLNNYLK